MNGCSAFAIIIGLAHSVLYVSDVRGQPKASYDQHAEVYRQQIEMTLPPPYLHLRWPDPPVTGYYAWKVTFGRDSTTAIVFRTDTTIAARSLRDVIRAGALYLCPSSDAPVLECTVKIRGNARRGSGGLDLQITEPRVVQRVRARQPDVYLRQSSNGEGDSASTNARDVVMLKLRRLLLCDKHLR